MALETGKRVFEILTQSPGDTYSLMSQQLMMDIVMNLEQGDALDIGALKIKVAEFAAAIETDEQYDKIRDQLRAVCVTVHQPTKEEKNTEESSENKINEEGKDDKDKKYKEEDVNSGKPDKQPEKADLKEAEKSGDKAEKLELKK